MKSWQINDLETRPHVPEILSSNDEARTVVLKLPAGESLKDHEVHERAFLVVIDGQIDAKAEPGDNASGGPGLLLEFDPKERHEISARSDATLLLVLTPWPGDGHPGAMTLDEKSHARERAAEKADPS